MVDSYVRNPDRAHQLGYRKQEKQFSHPVGTVIVIRTEEEHDASLCFIQFYTDSTFLR